MSISQPTYAEKRKKWLDVLSGEDRHSIVHQLIQLTWDAASFQIINEARLLAPADPEGGLQLNGLLHGLINRGFSSCALMSVRRLMDTYDIDGKRGVFSLTGLIKDMQKHHSLFTRKAIFDAEGLQLDYEDVRQKCLEFEHTKKDDGVFFTPNGLDWHRHKNRHVELGRLMGVSLEDRQEEDTVAVQVFINLHSKVEAACEEMRVHVDKFIAHSATQYSREIENADEIAITLNHICEAQQSLCEVTSFIANVLLGDSCTCFLPTALDKFKYLDRPLVEEAHMTELHEHWQVLKNKDHAWSQWTLDDYQQEFPEQEDI